MQGAHADTEGHEWGRFNTHSQCRHITEGCQHGLKHTPVISCHFDAYQFVFKEIA